MITNGTFNHVMISMLITICCVPGIVNAKEEPGYFLPMEQKGNLIWQGVVEDSKGLWYYIRIVPGYQRNTDDRRHLVGIKL